MVAAAPVDRIAAESDVVVRFGFNLLTGRVLSEPEYRVLRFHPGDVRRYRGLSPARMFLNCERTAGVALQQLTDEFDAGNVVLTESTDVADARTLDGIQRRLNELKVEMLPAGVERPREPDAELSPPESLADYVSVKECRSRGRY